LKQNQVMSSLRFMWNCLWSKAFVVEKPSIVEASLDVTFYIEAFIYVKPSIDGATVFKLSDNEVDTSSYFSFEDTWKVREDVIGWVRRQARKARW